MCSFRDYRVEIKKKKEENNRTHPIKKKLTHRVPGVLQVPTTQLAKVSIDPKFVKLAADSP